MRGLFPPLFSSLLLSFLSSPLIFFRPHRERRRNRSQRERAMRNEKGEMVGLPLASTRVSNYHRGFACISCLILAFPSSQYPSSFGFLTSFARTVSLFFIFSALLPSLASRVTLCVTLLSSLRPYLAIEIRACRAHTERGDSSPRAELLLTRSCLPFR